MDLEGTDSLPMDDIVDQPRLVDSAPEPQATETDAEAKARERDEQGRFKAKEKGETEEAPPASEPDNVPVKALQEERRKRQELEQTVAQLKEQFAQQQPAQQPPSVFEDEQGAFSRHGDEITQKAVQWASMNARLDTSEMLARQANPDDFDQLKTEFLAMAEQNPELRQQALADPHPWAKAMQIARNVRTMKDLGATNIDDLRKSIRAELEAELKANAPRFPTSTAQDGSVAARGGPVWTGPTPDKAVLPMG